MKKKIMKKKTRERQRIYHSSDGETYWSLVKGTYWSYWFHMVRGKNYPDVMTTELEIPHCLFIFDKERI